MSSASRARPSPEDYYNDMVRRMVSLPRSLLGGFSRAMGIGGGSGRNHHHLQPPPVPPPPPPVAYPYYPQEPSLVQDQWSFLSTFESSYGQTHPFFYACRLNEALRLAHEDEDGKLLFMYLHYPDHTNPFTASFCRDTLCSELVIQFVDANFVSWGGLADRGEGLQMAESLRPSTFPFCAVIAPARDDNITVLQQIEGPVSPAQLVEILQRTMDDQGVAFGSSKAKEEHKRRADRRLREEQDAAYLAALKLDQEKERAPSKGRPSKVKESATTARENQPRSNATKGPITQILVRFPNGERLEQSFSVSDKVQAVFRYVDSLGVPGVENYRLVSSFPRKAYGVDQMNMSFKEAGLYPKATLFLEPL